MERSFLPSHLEILESPPNPASRAMFWGLALMLGVVLVWLISGRLDVVVSANSLVVVSGGSKVVQSPDGGIVRGVFVKDGEHVLEGALLIQLDSQVLSADEKRVTYELAATDKEIQRLESFVAWMDGGQFMVDDVFASQTASYIARKEELIASIEAKKNELDSMSARLEEYERTLPLIAGRAESFSSLAEKQLVSRAQWSELEQQRIEGEQRVKSTRHQISSIQMEIRKLYVQINSFSAEHRLRAKERLAVLFPQRESLRLEQTKLHSRLAQLSLRAPVAGYVQELSVHTVGGVVNAVDALMVIVPDDAGVEIEARILSKDIGFVQEGQTVNVKVDAFPFTQYGTMTGVLSTLNSEAVRDDALGMIYKAKISLSQTDKDADGWSSRLSAGMTATAEIHTGHRSLMMYLLDPVLTRVDEAGRER